MALVNMVDMLQDAREGHYAVGAFDVSNLEMVRAVVEVAEEERSPVILMGLKPDLEGRGLDYFMAMTTLAAKSASVPVCIHLDHATDYEDIKRAIDHGFTSVMYDGSVLPLEENIAGTKEVVDLAHQHGVSVEAELGHVGDGIVGSSESEMHVGAEGVLTVPDEMKRFLEETGVDALAVAVGTAHGVYISEPKLDIERLALLNEISHVPLVLHGGSGTPEEGVKSAISMGISKINIFSEVLDSYYSTLRDYLNSKDNMAIWPCIANEKPVASMKAMVRKKIRLFGSNNRV